MRVLCRCPARWTAGQICKWKSVHCLTLAYFGKKLYITELDMDGERWDAYSKFGDPRKITNPWWREETILCEPYGWKYLDAEIVKMYGYSCRRRWDSWKSVLYLLSRDMYGSYSNEMNGFTKVYHMKDIVGPDNKVNEGWIFGRITRDENDPEKGSIYVINSDEVSKNI